METVKFGELDVSTMILGGNPFSGFSHQSPERDEEMVRYFTTEAIKDTMHQAEALGVNTFLGRADRHIRRTLMEYWNEGGEIQWLAQTCPEYASLPGCVAGALAAGASAVYIHGGQMDYLYAQNELDIVYDVIAQIKEAGAAAGIAAHNPDVHRWANEHLDLDFHMCSYYNPSSRDENAEHQAGVREVFSDDDRAAMVEVIKELQAPAIHYKVMAAGRKSPQEAFDFVADHLRPQDAVCVGVFPKDKPGMLAEDVRLLELALGR
jgi:hypothetical protein